MGGLPIVIVGALIAWANIAAIRALRERRAGPRWWYAAATLWAVGALAGVWGGFFLEYQMSPRLRVHGAPIPMGMEVSEGPPGDERWVGFVSSAPHVFAAANVPLVALLAGSTIGPAYWLAGVGDGARRRKQTDATQRQRTEPAENNTHPLTQRSRTTPAATSITDQRGSRSGRVSRST